MTDQRTYAQPTQQQAEAVWMDAMLGGASGDLPGRLAGELAAYTGEPVETVLERMQHGTEELADLWRQRAVDPADPQALHAFYNAGLTEAYELLHWHAGELGRCPIQHVMAAWLGQALGARRVLDYGAGIGSPGILLARHGFEVSLADIARPLLEFSRARLTQRGIEASYYLLPGQRPPRSTFDLVLCTDVLEHVPDPERVVNEIAGYLRTGGVLVATLYEDSSHPDRPMHVSSCASVADFARQTSLWVDWRLTERIRQWGGWSVVLRKLPAGGLLRAAERVAERVLPRSVATLGPAVKRVLEKALPLRQASGPSGES